MKKQPTEPLEVSQYPSEVLAELMFDEGSETYEMLMSGILEATEVARIAIEDNFNKDPNDNWNLERAYQAQQKFLPGQLLYFLPEARAVPESNLGKEEFDSFLLQLLRSYNKHYNESLTQKGGLKKNNNGVYVDLDFTINIILDFSVVARFNRLSHKSKDPEALIYFPPIIAKGSVNVQKKIQDTLSESIEKTLLEPERLKDFGKHPDWLLIVPPKMLSKNFLENHPEFAEALIEALGAIIFMRVCAQICFDEILTARCYIPLWTLYFKRKKAAINNSSPVLFNAIKTIWACKNTGIPRSLQKYINQKPAEKVQRKIVEQVTPIIETPKIVFAPPTPLRYQVEGKKIALTTETISDEAYLHIVVWEKTNSGNRRNPHFYCFSDTKSAQIPKPEKKFEITAFWCDQNIPFSGQPELSVVPDNAYCETTNTTPRPPEITQETNPFSYKPKTYTVDTSTSRNPSMIEATARLTEASNWQDKLALKLIEYAHHLDQVFENPNWHNDNQVSFYVKDEDSKAYFTIQIEPLRLITPDYEITENYLREDAFPLLIQWAQAKKSITEDRKRMDRERAEVLNWRRENKTREALALSCRQATNHKTWQEYEFKTINEQIVFEWDRAISLAKFENQKNRLIAELNEVGINASIESSPLKAPSKKDNKKPKITAGPVVIKQVNFEIQSLGIKFAVVVNRNPGDTPFDFIFSEEMSDTWRNEAARWAAGSLCLLGLITEPLEKSPFLGKANVTQKNSSGFCFEQKPKKTRHSSETEKDSSYLPMIKRFNERRGRVKSVATGRGFEWGGSWADFADADSAVYQNAYFQEVKGRTAQDSITEYETIEQPSWQKYIILRVWKTLSMNENLEQLNHQSSVGPLKGKMKAVLAETWGQLSEDEKLAFSKIYSPTKACDFMFTRLHLSEEGKVNSKTQESFVKTLIDGWQNANVGLNITPNPVYKKFDEIVRFCALNNEVVVANTPADFEALNEPCYLALGLRIEKNF